MQLLPIRLYLRVDDDGIVTVRAHANLNNRHYSSVDNASTDAAIESLRQAVEYDTLAIWPGAREGE